MEQVRLQQANMAVGETAARDMFSKLGSFARWIGSSISSMEEAEFGLQQVHGAAGFLAFHLFEMQDEPGNAIIRAAEEEFASSGKFQKEAVASYRRIRSSMDSFPSPVGWGLNIRDIKKMVN